MHVVPGPDPHVWVPMPGARPADATRRFAADVFVATPPDSASVVNLFRCTSGVNCHSLDFQNDQIADSNALGGDTGAFYLPFLLDPQNSADLLLGTCRIWRGATIGGSFSLLSPDF